MFFQPQKKLFEATGIALRSRLRSVGVGPGWGGGPGRFTNPAPDRPRKPGRGGGVWPPGPGPLFHRGRQSSRRFNTGRDFHDFVRIRVGSVLNRKNSEQKIKAVGGSRVSRVTSGASASDLPGSARSALRKQLRTNNIFCMDLNLAGSA